jgi:hypothetical protein
MGLSLNGISFDKDPDDTCQYKTHAEWCRYLASRNVLSPDHRACKDRMICVSGQVRELLRGRGWKVDDLPEVSR